MVAKLLVLGVVAALAWLGGGDRVAAQVNPNPARSLSGIAPMQPSVTLRSPRSFRDGTDAVTPTPEKPKRVKKVRSGAAVR